MSEQSTCLHGNHLQPWPCHLYVDNNCEMLTLTENTTHNHVKIENRVSSPGLSLEFHDHKE